MAIITRRQGMTRQDAESRGWSWEKGIGTVSYTVAGAEVQPPSTAGPAQGDLGGLCGRQQAAVIGQAVPIVFARRVGDRGGVFITPPATDARYENDASNELTAKYHLILGDGPMGSVQVRDVFQCTCRIGSFTQTYNQRAGDWDPGNFLVERVGYTLQNVPDYCGSKGTCEGLSTMSYENTYPDGSGDWALEVQIFIREGRTVTRLADSVSGPSSNFADLFKLAMEVGAKLPADMIDTTRLQTAALFLDANQLYCDINIKEAGNLDDFISANAPYFLVRETRVDGKRGLRPLLPIDGAYAIKTDPIPWEFEFNEDFIIPGSLQVDFTPLEQRKPKLMLGMWRQQPGDTFGVIRTAEVGYGADRDSGNVEQHDMSTFCTHELHAVRAMAYKRARQKWSTHTISWACRPEVYNRILEEGDIVRLTYQRNASDGSTTTHDYLYELDQIEKTSTGEIVFQATHFPVDAEGRSLVALTVAQAEAQGHDYADNIRTGIDCDENSSADTSVPAEVFQAVAPGDPPNPPPPPPSLLPVPSGSPGGYPPPPVPPSPIPTPPDDPVDPCEPICTSGSICGEVGEPAPTCPAGTTNVGTITAHQPDGDQTCVICESCVAPDDPSCPPIGETGYWRYVLTSSTGCATSGLTGSAAATSTTSIWFTVNANNQYIWGWDSLEPNTWPAPPFPQYTSGSGSGVLNASGSQEVLSCPPGAVVNADIAWLARYDVVNGVASGSPTYVPVALSIDGCACLPAGPEGSTHTYSGRWEFSPNQNPNNITWSSS